LHPQLDLALEATNGPWAEAWQRDKGVLWLAKHAQARRLQKAMIELGILPETEIGVRK